MSQLQRAHSFTAARQRDVADDGDGEANTDAWAARRAARIDTHNLSPEEAIQAITASLTRCAASPQTAPPDGLTIEHGIGRHSATPFAPPTRTRILQFLATHPARPDFSDITADGEEAPHAIHLDLITLLLASVWHGPSPPPPPEPLRGGADSVVSNTPTTPTPPASGRPAPRSNNRTHGHTSATDHAGAPTFHTTAGPNNGGAGLDLALDAAVPTLMLHAPEPSVTPALPARDGIPPTIDLQPFVAAVHLLMSDARVIADIASIPPTQMPTAASHPPRPSIAAQLANIARATCAPSLLLRELVTLAIMCRSRMATMERDPLIGSPAQFTEADDPAALLRLMTSEDTRVAAAFYRRHSLTAQPQATATALVLRAQMTLISPPKVPGEPWPPPNRPPHEPGVALIAATRAAGTVHAPPPRLLMRLVRGTSGTAGTGTEQYPCSLPMRLPFPTAHATTLLRLTVAVLIEGGTRTCPSYAVLRRENDTTWTLYPYAQPPETLTSEQANDRMHPDDPQSTTATIAVYAAQTQAAPTTHKERQRKKNWTKRAQPSTTAPPHLPLAVTVPDEADDHETLMSLIYEFAVDSAVMPSNFSPQSAVHRIDASWAAFRMFAARMLATDPTAPPNLALVDALSARLTLSDDQAIADASLKRLALQAAVQPGISPRMRLNNRLTAGPRPHPAPRLTLEPCRAQDGTHAVTATMTGELPNGERITTVGFGFSTEGQREASCAARDSAAHALMHRLLALARPSTLGAMALFRPRRPTGSATSASSPGTIPDAAPRLGTSRRFTQWTNDMTALFGYAPLEQRLGSSYADVVLPSGRSLELQHVDIDPATIMRRRHDHTTHGAGDPIWWLDAPSMLMSSAGKGFDILAYHRPNLLLVRLTSSKAARRCVAALGPDVVFDLAYRNVVLLAAGPVVHTPAPCMWMRVAPLLPILFRLGALEHYHRAYGGTPAFATRPDVATFDDFIHTGDDPVPQYRRDMPHPPPPPAPGEAELDRITNPDLAANDAHAHAQQGQQLQRHVSPCTIQTAVISAYVSPSRTQAAHFRITYADGGLATIPVAAATEPTDPDDFPYTIAAADDATAARNQQAARAATRTCSACGAIPTPPHTLESCFVCAAPFHASCCSPPVPHPDAHPTPRRGYDWICAGCVEAHNLSGGLVISPAALPAPLQHGQQPSPPGEIPTMSVADDPRLPAATPRPVPPPLPTGAGHPLHTPADARRMRDVPVMRATRHAQYAPAQWRDFYLTTMRRVNFAAYSRQWGTTLAERFTSYMGIIRATLVGIFAKPDDMDGMAVPIRCVNTVEELAEYDAELAQAAQRQTES